MVAINTNQSKGGPGLRETAVAGNKAGRKVKRFRPDPPLSHRDKALRVLLARTVVSCYIQDVYWIFTGSGKLHTNYGRAKH